MREAKDPNQTAKQKATATETHNALTLSSKVTTRTSKVQTISTHFTPLFRTKSGQTIKTITGEAKSPNSAKIATSTAPKTPGSPVKIPTTINAKTVTGHMRTAGSSLVTRSPKTRTTTSGRASRATTSSSQRLKGSSSTSTSKTIRTMPETSKINGRNSSKIGRKCRRMKNGALSGNKNTGLTNRARTQTSIGATEAYFRTRL